METTAHKGKIFCVANVIEHLGLALMIGGMLALGAFVAPAVFEYFPRHEAGRVMTAIFRRYDNILSFSLILIVVGEILRTYTLGFSRHFLARMRYVAVIFLTVLSTFSLAIINPRMEAYQKSGVIRGTGTEGVKFDRLHKQSEALYKGELLLGIALLVFVSLSVKNFKDN